MNGLVKRDMIMLTIWLVSRIKYPIVCCKFEIAICDDCRPPEDQHYFVIILYYMLLIMLLQLPQSFPFCLPPTSCTLHPDSIKFLTPSTGSGTQLMLSKCGLSGWLTDCIYLGANITKKIIKL